MATIIATPYPDRGQILVQTQWSEGGATCVQVRRVVTSTGESAPLRTYVYPCSESGEYQHLSGGYASFWDTEAPLDEPFTYEATAIDSTGNPIGQTIVAPGTGGLALPNPNVAATPGSASTPDNAALDIVGDLDIRVDATLSSAMWTAISSAALVAKYNSATNNRSYRFYIENGLLRLAWSTNGIAVNATSPSFAVTPATSGRLAVRATLDVDNGAGQHMVTFYTAPTMAGPWTALGPTLTFAGTTSIFNSNANMFIGADGVGAGSLVQGGTIHSVQVRNGINGTLVANPQFFNQANGTTSFTDAPGRVWTVNSPARIVNSRSAVTATSSSVTLNSNGSFWLRDPVRPCNDREVLICFDTADVACAAGNGIFFAQMDAETYTNNSYINLPTNARRPIATARTRRDANTSLTLVTRTFEDRDAVLALNEPGSPLQFVAPPKYGIPDRYMTVDNVQVARGLSDHRFQPRIIQMPYTTVDRPVGPTQGVCGSRFEDLCDTYATWTAAEASGLAWSTLVEGTPAALGVRTWGDVNSTFANWTAVQANGTWQDALEP